MDSFLAGMLSQEDDDLVLCMGNGAAYQKDQTKLIEYDGAYFSKCAGYEGQEIADRLNDGRVAFVKQYYGDGPALDIGIGSGEFIRRRPRTFGMDVNPVARDWLMKMGLWADDIENFYAFTMYDVVEHVPTPADYFNRMRCGSHLFTSIPIFKDLRRIRESKHYRPGEHLYYWTEPGFVAWMAMHGFMHLDTQDFETRAGRDSILSFAFRKG